eukprot:3953802-Amphidinium_carterae.1
MDEWSSISSDCRDLRLLSAARPTFIDGNEVDGSGKQEPGDMRESHSVTYVATYVGYVKQISCVSLVEDGPLGAVCRHAIQAAWTELCTCTRPNERKQ